MRKILKVMGVVAVCATFAVVAYNQVNAKPGNSILAKNIEALSQSEVIGSVKCYMSFDDPGWFVDDIWQVLCVHPKTGDMCVQVKGHDFSNPARCSGIQ